MTQAHSQSYPPNRKPSTRSHASTGRESVNPVDYKHPHPSMRKFAEFLALRYNCNRTRHAYYRQLRLLHEYFSCDPEIIIEDQIREYLLHLKLNKEWKPNSLRQAIASMRHFFERVLKQEPMPVFSQVTTKDHRHLPRVLSHKQICALLKSIRLRRYRIPIKLIYCCGLRLSECLALTIHDINGEENKLNVRDGKGKVDRVIPLPQRMLEDLRNYWSFHRNPLFLFPKVGRGSKKQEVLAQRMREAKSPMPHGSLQRLLVAARKELNIPDATPHVLRHSYATHLIEAGAGIHCVKRLLGHQSIEVTMVYLHLTHESEVNVLELVNELCDALPG